MGSRAVSKKADRTAYDALISDALIKLPTCFGLVVYVADLLWTCYGETGIMDFGLYQTFVIQRTVSEVVDARCVAECCPTRYQMNGDDCRSQALTTFNGDN